MYSEVGRGRLGEPEVHFRRVQMDFGGEGWSRDRRTGRIVPIDRDGNVCRSGDGFDTVSDLWEVERHRLLENESSTVSLQWRRSFGVKGRIGY